MSREPAPPASAVPLSDELLRLLEDARRAEKEQALRYRSLAAKAEEEAPELAERFHDLHADEQHHLSRLTARLLELRARPIDLNDVRIDGVPLAEWEAEVRDHEAGEIERYRHLLTHELDDETRALIEQILATEELHGRELGGKWTMA